MKTTLKTKKIFVIIDWAYNYLQYNGRFNFSAYGANIGAPKKFKSFDAASAWLDSNIKNESDREDLYIEQLKTEEA